MIRRIPAKYAVTTAALLVSLFLSEGYIDVAKRPIPGDKCTSGFGSTEGVKCGDKTDPVRAAVRAATELERNYAEPVRQCLGDTFVSQGEANALFDLAYRIGAPSVCSRAKPGKPPKLMDLFHEGRYDEACRRILEFNCGPSGNPGVTVDKCGPGKMIHSGVQNRANKEYQLCMEGK